jgi:hypothetical protein
VELRLSGVLRLDSGEDSLDVAGHFTTTSFLSDDRSATTALMASIAALRFSIQLAHRPRGG